MEYIEIRPQEAVAMGVRSRVPELLVQKGWDAKTFAAYCMLKGMSPDTAYRMARGETEFRTSTLARAVEVLGVDGISDIIVVESSPKCQ